MEEAIRQAVDAVIPVVEAIGAVVIVVGVLVSFGFWVAAELRLHAASYEEIRVRLARFLALGLEFQLGADILGTAVSPTFEEIGRLGAIAAIRTLLNYFLQRDLDTMRGTGRPDPMPGAR
ncbi:MAG: DUF1622 domain-containing protein [Actinomycetota bacterium]|nr:DUF1622 domain-containing protein [Actinomycetota bacterium]